MGGTGTGGSEGFLGLRLGPKSSWLAPLVEVNNDKFDIKSALALTAGFVCSSKCGEGGEIETGIARSGDPGGFLGLAWAPSPLGPKHRGQKKMKAAVPPVLDTG